MQDDRPEAAAPREKKRRQRGYRPIANDALLLLRDMLVERDVAFEFRAPFRGVAPEVYVDYGEENAVAVVWASWYGYLEHTNTDKRTPNWILSRVSLHSTRRCQHAEAQAADMFRHLCDAGIIFPRAVLK